MVRPTEPVKACAWLGAAALTGFHVAESLHQPESATSPNQLLVAPFMSMMAGVALVPGDTLPEARDCALNCKYFCYATLCEAKPMLRISYRSCPITSRCFSWDEERSASLSTCGDSLHRTEGQRGDDGRQPPGTKAHRPAERAGTDARAAWRRPRRTSGRDRSPARPSCSTQGLRRGTEEVPHDTFLNRAQEAAL